MGESEKKRNDLFRDRVTCMLKQGYSIAKIAKELGRTYDHTRNIALQIKGDVKDQAQ